MKLLKDFAPLILLVITFITLLKLFSRNTGTYSPADTYYNTIAQRAADSVKEVNNNIAFIQALATPTIIK